MFPSNTTFDVAVVGAGATGGWAAKTLTGLGLNVALIEAGSPPGAATSGTPTEPKRAVYPRQKVQSRCYAFNDVTSHLFVDDLDHPYETPPGMPFTWIRIRGLGGRTAVWARVALRMSDKQFFAASRDGFGIDWPISYGNLSPHYDDVERFFGVEGIAEGLEEIPDGCFLGTRLSAAAQECKQAIEARWPDRRLTALRLLGSAKAPVEDVAHRRESSLSQLPRPCATAAVEEACATNRLTLIGDSIVSGIATDRSGTLARGVEVIERVSLRCHEVHARVVVLCASTIETTRILLNTTSPAHPNGLGNGNDVLGRFLTEHTSGVSVFGAKRKTTRGNNETPCAVYLPNFRNTTKARAGFLRGYGIQGQIFTFPDGLTTGCMLFCFGEMLPRAQNRVTLSRSLKDRWGIPAPNIACSLSDNERAMIEDQQKQLAEMLKEAGYEVIRVTGVSEPGSSIHEVGSARMGSDSKSSVLNRHNQCWEAPNVFVTDGAAFSSVGFQNPTLTMMALTGKACHYIADELRRGEWWR